jgi:death-on-curing protein
VRKEPSWLTAEAVLAMHEQLVAEHGGDAAVRDRGLVESALAAPRHHYTYGERDIFVLAAAYAYGITRNHAFIDGNKRTAFLAAYTFLGINGWDLNAPEEQVVQMVVGLSDRSVSVEAFAEWLRTACRKPRRKRE